MQETLMDYLTCRTLIRRIRGSLFQWAGRKSVAAAVDEVHTRADLLHPQRVTSRWVGKSRNNSQGPTRCLLSQ